MNGWSSWSRASQDEPDCGPRFFSPAESLSHKISTAKDGRERRSPVPRNIVHCGVDPIGRFQTNNHCQNVNRHRRRTPYTGSTPLDFPYSPLDAHHPSSVSAPNSTRQHHHCPATAHGRRAQVRHSGAATDTSPAYSTGKHTNDTHFARQPLRSVCGSHLYSSPHCCAMLRPTSRHRSVVLRSKTTLPRG